LQQLKKNVGLPLILFFAFILLSTKMRIRIIFQLLNQGGIVPFHQQALLSSFVHDFLPSRLSPSDTWTFSGLKGQTKVTAKGLYYNSQKVTLVFSTPSRELAEAFVNAIFTNGIFGLAGLELQPIQVLEEIVAFEGDSVKYICISPLVVLAEGFPDPELKQFISPASGSFADLLYESTMSRMEKAGVPLHNAAENSFFNFRPDEEYLHRAKETDKKYSRIYALEGFGNYSELRGYTLPFYLDAAPEIHEFIFNSGLGEATRYGFGMVDLADRTGKTQTREFSFNRNQEARWA
jgi:CRISPR-associated endoribonuclease Cas6